MASAHHNTVVFNDVKQPMAVDTPLFSGTALLLLRNMPNTPKGVFEGKRRQMVLTVQVGCHDVAGSRLPRTLQLLTHICDTMSRAGAAERKPPVQVSEPPLPAIGQHQQAPPVVLPHSQLVAAPRLLAVDLTALSETV
jgi:hypothetical protein